jgi:hypothetical protein
MPVERVLRGTSDKKPTNRLRPVVIKWKGIPMIRKHSFIAAIKEIVTFSNEMDFTKIGLVGDQHSGKSTLARAIAHIIHTFSEVPFTIKLFTQEELLDFENTLKTLTPTNYILIFDDISFLSANASKKDIDVIKQAITKIRHLDEEHDVKIITILNYHYSLGLDKYLRQTDFKFFTTVGTSEAENVEAQTGGKSGKLIREFQKKRYVGIVKKLIPFKIGQKEIFSYKYRDPFIPVLFYNTNSLRIIVAPKQEWMEPMCSKCAEANGMLTSSGIPIPQFMEESEEKFGKGAWLSAIKLALYTEGKTTYNGNVVRALKYLNKCRKTKYISLEESAAHYDLTITKTRLRKKMSGVMVPTPGEVEQDPITVE